MTFDVDNIAPVQRWQPPRDGWGRPLIVPPGGGKPVAYTRTTTVAKTLDDEGALTKWAQRMTAAGLVRRPDLVALIASKLTPGGDIPEEAKNEVNKLCDQAKEAAASSAAANLGTALHAMTETLDGGGAVSHVPGNLQADLDAYRAKTAGIEMLAIENFVVLDEHKVAGTFDRLCRLPDGRTVIADLKTGKDLSYSWRSIAVQLAIYAHGLLYTEDGRSALPADLDITTALVIHLPVGGATCTLHELDIAAGWEAFEHSMWARAWRSRRDLARPLTIRPAPARSTTPSDAAPAPLEASTAQTPAQGEAPGQADPSLRAWIVERIVALPAEARASLAQHWPDGVPTLKAFDGHTEAQLDAIDGVLARVEAAHAVPFGAPDPRKPAPAPRTRTVPERTTPVHLDEGPTMTTSDVDALREALEALVDEQRLTIVGWHRDAHEAGRSFSLSVLPSARRFEILRAAIAAVTSLGDDELMRAALAAVMGTDAPLQPTITIGAALGALTIDEAQRLAGLAERFDAGQAVTTVDDAGAIRFLSLELVA